MKTTLKNLMFRLQIQKTVRTARFDLLRMKARRRTQKMLNRHLTKGPLPDKFHFGCGKRLVDGWLNCDLINSQVDIDLGCGSLPFADESFSAICSQHVIEHLDLVSELEPLTKELLRCSRSGAEIWLSCPDMEKVCRSYLDHKGMDLIEDRRTRLPDFTTGKYPSSFMINNLFHQGGEHRNLFDFDLLKALLDQSGFSNVTRESEETFLLRFPEFPRRNDDLQSLYVRAEKA